MSISATAAAERAATAGQPTDHQLVAAVRRGDDWAFERLYARYQRRVAAYVYGMVLDYGRAEDITQDVFIAALRRMRETERPIAFKPWVYEIAKNACIDQFRRSRRGEEVSYDVLEGIGTADHVRLASTATGPEDAVDTKQQLADLCGAFGGLSEVHHQILVLRELEGLSYREIGDRMGMSLASVESTLFRARRRLSEEYAELVSGERCRRVQALMSAGALGTRDSRRLARHLSHCQPCRRQAHLHGLDPAELAPRRRGRGVAERIAGLLPLPAFERFRRGPDATEPVGTSLGLHAQNTAAQWSGAIGSLSEPVLAGGWGRGIATAASVVVASVGASIGADHGSKSLADRLAPASAAAAPAAPAGATPAAGKPTPAPRGAVGRLADRPASKIERRRPVARIRRPARDRTAAGAAKPPASSSDSSAAPPATKPAAPALPSLPQLPSLPAASGAGGERPLQRLAEPLPAGRLPQGRPIRDEVPAETRRRRRPTAGRCGPDAGRGGRRRRAVGGGCRRARGESAQLTGAMSKKDERAFRDSLTDTNLFSIGAFFQDAHPDLVEDVMEESEAIEKIGLAAYAKREDLDIEAAFQTLVTGLAIRYHRAVSG